MLKSAVTVSLVAEAQGGPFVFWYDVAAACQQAKSLGFDGIEIFPPGAEALEEATIRPLLADHGLKLAAVGTGGGWVKHKLHLVLPDATARTKAKEFIRGIIDRAGALGAPAIIGSMQGRWGDTVDRPTALRWLADALVELGEYARQYGVPLLYETLNRYETNLFTTLQAAVQFLNGIACDNVKLLADLFHMNIEEVSIADALRGAKGHIGHVHFVDSNRRAAGMGHMDYAPIFSALKEIGYDRFLSAEAFALPDSFTAAQQTITTFRRYASGNA